MTSLPLTRHLGLAVGLAILVLITALIGSNPAFGQQAILRGFVTDEVTEQPLQLASVILQNETDQVQGAVTDGDGYFIIRRIPPGTYSLTVSFVGFISYQEELLLSAGEIANKTIVLSPGAEELEEVVVEAEEDIGITSVVAGLETMIPAQIERVPMPGATGDLASYLQTVPGVTIQGDRGGQFFVRGGAVDQNLALLDGMPVYMPFHVLSFYSAFPEETMDNASFYTGGFGAAYGSRVSSVLDVRARNGNKQNLAGSFSLAPFLSTLRVEGPLVKEKVSLLASGRHSLIEDIIPTISGQDLPYEFGDLFGKLHAFITPQHSVSFTGLHTYDRGDLAGTLKTFDGESISQPVSDSTEIAWNNTVLGGIYTFLPEELPLFMQLSANSSEMSNKMGPRNARERTSGIKSYDLKADFTYFLDRSELRLGVLRRESTLDYSLGGQFQGIPEEASNDLIEWSAYVETEFNLQSGLLKIQPGLHFYTLPGRSEQWIDPRARITWTPPLFESSVKINAAAGIYHQAIAGLNDERDVGNIFTAWIPIPTDSPITSSFHAILGTNVQIQPWLSVALEGFIKRYDNLSVPSFSATPSFTTTLQEADGEAYGFDARIDLQNQPFWYESILDGYVSYSLSRVDYMTSSVEYTPPHDRRHQFNALLQAEKDGTSLTLQWQYGTGLPFTESAGFDIWLLLTPDIDVTSEPGEQRIAYGAPYEGRQPDYQRVDIWIERKVERGRTVVTLRAGGINILNRNNLFYYDLFEFRRVDQLPFVPSVGLKVELR